MSGAAGASECGAWRATRVARCRRLTSGGRCYIHADGPDLRPNVHTLVHLQCRATKANGQGCKGWAGRDGLCPVHGGRNAAQGGRVAEAASKQADQR